MGVLEWAERGSATDSEDRKRGRRGDKGKIIGGGGESEHITSLQAPSPSSAGRATRMEREGAEGTGVNYWRGGESEYITALQAPSPSLRREQLIMEREGAEGTGENCWRGE